jgi:hypothetical protein
MDYNFYLDFGSQLVKRDLLTRLIALSCNYNYYLYIYSPCKMLAKVSRRVKTTIFPEIWQEY